MCACVSNITLIRLVTVSDLPCNFLQEIRYQKTPETLKMAASQLR